MELDLVIESKKDNGLLVVSTSGELDDFNAPKLFDYFEDAIDQKGENRIILNLKNTAFVDSVGLGTIVRVFKKVREINGDFSVVCTRPHLITLFQNAGIINKPNGLELFASVEAASMKNG